MAKRLVHTATHTSGSGSVHTAKVYRCTEWNEWIVKFSKEIRKMLPLKALYMYAAVIVAIMTIWSFS